jgi:23S rRNA (cytidine1920-2'-O)/16S rRNA (cytidine1409-2'-O)-methyltransferase
VMERTNARTLDGLPEPCSLLVADLSFISLAPILPVIRRLAGGGEAVLLVKPQFEVGRSRIGKGGLVRDEDARQEALDGVIAQAEAMGMTTRGHMESPVAGARAGNREWLLHLAVLS